MRATPQEQKGGAGVHEVAANFERIGWGPAENPHHDLGTDLYLALRDDRLVELGLIAGAQVKAGPSYFEEPELGEAGEVIGWWYRESRRNHFDYWIQHRAPHFLVLHDLDLKQSYWVLVTEETVDFVGKGAKVLVPADQTVDAEHAEALRSAVGRRTGQHSWEGSSWTGAAKLSPTHLYRHALVVPRLIAPHPNMSVTTITAAQALSLVILGRDSRYRRNPKSDMPNLGEIDDTWDWEWQLAAGLQQFLSRSDLSALRGAFDAATDPHQQAASAVVLAASYIEDCQPVAAAEATLRVLEDDQLEAVDHGWVRLQHARAQFELGNFDDARSISFDLIKLSSVVPDDVTAAAISGAAANLLFAVADWDDLDFGQTIAAADTTAVWWRQAVAVQGLGRQADEAFKAWAHDPQYVYSTEQAWDDLRAASLMAGFLGDHRGWAGALGRLARYVLTHADFGEDPKQIRSALRTLRMIGADKNIDVAVKWLSANGPAWVVKEVVDGCDPSAATVTSFRADLALLNAGGDLLEPEHAVNVARWAMANFDHPERLQDTFHVASDVQSRAAEVLGSIVDALPAEHHPQVLAWALATQSKTPGLTARPLRDLVRAIPAEAWTIETAMLAAARADDDPDTLKYAWLRAAVRHLPEVRQRLAREARTGSEDALWALGAVTGFDTDLVVDLIAYYSAAVSDHAATTNGHHGDGHDADTLALLNIWHPDHAAWAPLFELLESAGPSTSLASALNRLAGAAGQLADDIATRLLPSAQRLATLLPDEDDPRTSADNRPAARYLAAALERAAGRPHGLPMLRTLLGAGTTDRQSAALLCGEPDPFGDGVLTALTTDPDPRVRATTASVATYRAVRGEGLGLQLVIALREDPGVAVPVAIATELADHPSAEVLELVDNLFRHPSARVRKRIAQANACLDRSAP